MSCRHTVACFSVLLFFGAVFEARAADLKAGLKERINKTQAEVTRLEAEKAQSVANSVDAFDATARALVERAFGPFRETFDPVLVLDEGTGKLSSFGVPLNDEYSAVDKFSKDTGGVATVFARKGEDFVRIASSVKQDNGERAQGTTATRLFRLGGGDGFQKLQRSNGGNG